MENGSRGKHQRECDTTKHRGNQSAEFQTDQDGSTSHSSCSFGSYATTFGSYSVQIKLIETLVGSS